MSVTVPDASMIDLMWPADINKRRGPILVFWIAAEWFLLVTGTVGVFAATSGRQASGTLFLGEFPGWVFGTLFILFSITWAAVTYFAFKQRLWALRTGICFSLVVIALFLLALLYPVALKGGVLLVVAILIACLARWIAASNTTSQWSRVAYWAYYFIFVISSLIVYGWFLVSETSRENNAVIASCFMLIVCPQYLVPYVQTCRILLGCTKKSVDLMPQ